MLSLNWQCTQTEADILRLMYLVIYFGSRHPRPLKSIKWGKIGSLSLSAKSFLNYFQFLWINSFITNRYLKQYFVDIVLLVPKVLSAFYTFIVVILQITFNIYHLLVLMIIRKENVIVIFSRVIALIYF